MATATFTTVVDRSIGDPLTEAIWDDQIRDNLNSLASAHRNLLTNGGFEVWQRGAGAFTAAGAYAADRWRMSIAATTMTVTKETTTIDTASLSSLKAVNTGAGNNAILQRIEDYGQLRGRAVSFSCRVNQSSASAVTLQISDSAGNSVGAASATTGSWVTLTATRTIDAAATTLDVYVIMATGSTVYVDNAMLVIGPAPAPYQPLHPQEELSRCQRYYEVHGGVNGTVAVGGYQAAGSGATQYVPYSTTKGGTPTVTKNGTWGVVNCGQPSVSGGYTAGYSLTVAITALGSYAANANSSDDTIVSDWAP